MNLAQVRVDDRLIHGQVVVGCCGPLSVGRLILAHDAVAADVFQREIYLSSVPPDIQTEVLGLQDAAGRLRQLASSGDGIATMVVVADPPDLLALVEAGAPITEAVLGGLHARAGRDRELFDGLWVSSADLAALRAVRARGIDLVVQSVPGVSRQPVGADALDVGA